MNENEPSPEPPGRGRTPPGGTPRWERAAAILAAGLDLSPEKRRAWLDGLPDLDAALRAEVAALLDAADRAGDFLSPGEIRLDAFDFPEDETTEKEDP